MKDQNYVRHPTIWQTQNSYFDQRHYKPSHQRILEGLQPSDYFKGQANPYTGKVLGYYYSHWNNAPPRVTLQDPQNAYVHFGNLGPPNKQASACTQIPSSNLPENQDQMHIQMSNNNTSVPNASILNLDDWMKFG